MCREYEQLLEEGRAKGQQEAFFSVAQDMLALGTYAMEEIARISRLPLDEVQRIAAEMGR